MCGEQMKFPENWKNFLEEYSFLDSKKTYTNGSKLIPVFRVEQMVEHYMKATCDECKKILDNRDRRRGRMTRKECLNAAIDAVCKDRENTYGIPEDNFKLIAALWSTYTGTKISPRDVAVMMILLKVARVRTGTNHSDNFVDIAGYAACAAEIGESDKKQEIKKPKFRLEDYPGDYVMHCDTEEKAKIFCNFLHNAGRSWNAGTFYKEKTFWENYKENTVYLFNYGKYCNKRYTEDEGYTILKFDDFDWE